VLRWVVESPKIRALTGHKQQFTYAKWEKHETKT
jgi:hypothetical protein